MNSQRAYELRMDRNTVHKLKGRTDDLRVFKAYDRLEYLLYCWERDCEGDNNDNVEVE